MRKLNVLTNVGESIMEILNATHLHKTYGKRRNQVEVLKGISFQAQEGEFVGIMGPSGSGKTTLLNVLCSIDQPTS